MSCVAFIAVSFCLRPQAVESRVLVKADWPTGVAAGTAKSTNQAV
jgi:hypothetical protein